MVCSIFCALPAVGFTSRSKLGPHLPELRKQHDIEHLAQIADATGAAGATLQSDDALDRGDVVEAPAAKIILEVDELFGELIDLPMRLRRSVDHLPGLDHGGILLPLVAPIVSLRIRADGKA